jgi:hypothetical protein
MFYAFLGSSVEFAKIGTTSFLATWCLILGTSDHSRQEQGHMCLLQKKSASSWRIFDFYGCSQGFAKIGTIFFFGNVVFDSECF